MSHTCRDLSPAAAGALGEAEAIAMPVQMGQSQPKRGDLICAGSVCENTGAGSLRLAPGSMLVNPVSWLEPPCSARNGLQLVHACLCVPRPQQVLAFHTGSTLGRIHGSLTLHGMRTGCCRRASKEPICMQVM